MNDAKPLLYGYMRVTEDVSDQEIAERELGMHAYAEAEGFALEAMFYDYTPGAWSAFDAMVEVLRRTGCRHVVVPSWENIANTEPMRAALVLKVEGATDGHVHELGSGS